MTGGGSALRQVLQALGHVKEIGIHGELSRAGEVSPRRLREPVKKAPVALLQAVQHQVHAFLHQRIPVQLHLVR